jgi:PKD repeat protein
MPTDMIYYVYALFIPAASFTADTISGQPGITVSFTDTSTNTPTSWSWNFGDSSSSTSQNPTHTYSTPGVYTVSLTVTNADGSDTITKTNLVNIGAGLTGISSVTGLSTISFS